MVLLGTLSAGQNSRTPQQSKQFQYQVSAQNDQSIFVVSIAWYKTSNYKRPIRLCIPWRCGTCSFVAMWHDICTCAYTHKDLIQSRYTIYYPTIYKSKSININIYSYLFLCGHILTTNIYWNAQNRTDCFTSGVFTVAPREKWWYPGNIVVVMRSMMGISCILYIYITGIITGYNLLLVSGLDKQSMGIVKSLGMTSWNNKNILSGDQMSYGVQVKYKTHGLQLICFFLGLFNIKKLDPYKVVYPVISWFRTSRDY